MKQLQGISVIVVEDNPDNLMLTTDILAGAGVTYCNARASGRQLFVLLNSKPDLQIDLILLDIQIPGEDGYTVLKTIRTTPRLKGTKVIAVTANVLASDIQRAQDAGFDGFIGKPINPDRFPDQLKQVLDGVQLWEPQSF